MKNIIGNEEKVDLSKIYRREIMAEVVNVLDDDNEDEIKVFGEHDTPKPDSSIETNHKRFRQKPIWQDLKIFSVSFMIFLTGSFMFVELVTGVVSGSLALLGDAFHMLSDLLALFVGLFSLIISKKGHSSRASFGYKRAELIGGLYNGVFLFALVIFLTVEVIHRFIERPEIEFSLSVVIVAFIGLIINLAGLFLFHHHSHDHDHDHGDKKEKSKKGFNRVNLALKGMFLHILGDLLGSLAALFSGSFITFTRFSWRYLADPVCTVIIILIIARNCIPLIVDCTRPLMQILPKHVKLAAISDEILEIEGVKAIHELHVWHFVQKTLIGSVHVIFESLDQFEEGGAKIKSVFHGHGIHSVSIQPEVMLEGRGDEYMAFCQLVCCDAEDFHEDHCCPQQLPPTMHIDGGTKVVCKPDCDAIHRHHFVKNDLITRSGVMAIVPVDDRETVVVGKEGELDVVVGSDNE